MIWDERRANGTDMSMIMTLNDNVCTYMQNKALLIMNIQFYKSWPEACSCWPWTPAIAFDPSPQLGNHPIYPAVDSLPVLDASYTLYLIIRRLLRDQRPPSSLLSAALSGSCCGAFLVPCADSVVAGRLGAPLLCTPSWSGMAAASRFPRAART
jgi:hypothetical protein